MCIMSVKPHFLHITLLNMITVFAHILLKNLFYFHTFQIYYQMMFIAHFVYNIVY